MKLELKCGCGRRQWVTYGEAFTCACGALGKPTGRFQDASMDQRHLPFCEDELESMIAFLESEVEAREIDNS